MADPQTPNKNLFTPAHGADIDTWDTPLNNNWNSLDLALGGSTGLNTTGLSGNIALTASQYGPLTLLLTGSPTGPISYVVPAGVGGQWVVRNDTVGGFAMALASASGGVPIQIAANAATLISCDGSASGMRFSISTPPSAAGGNQVIQFNNGGILAGSINLTFDGTTLFVTNLDITQNVVLGSGSGSILMIQGTTISTPNGADINSGQIQFGSSGGVGIGTTPNANLLSVGGTVESTTGGFKFPDGSSQTAAVPNYAVGTWTPLDNSGAGLVFTGVSASYTRIGNMVFAYFQLTYPSTGNGNSASIKGLPFTVANQPYAGVGALLDGFNSATDSYILRPTPNTTTALFRHNSANSNISNFSLSGVQFSCMLVYPVA